MSGLFRRIPSLVFAVLVVCVSVKAHAGTSYLFGATSEEIDEVMSDYFPRGYDQEAIHRQMTAPFDCANFGDLCELVGESYAYQIAEDTWARAVKRYSIDTLDRIAQQQVEEYGRRWFERLYPNGVSDLDAYWGVSARSSSCDNTVSATSGDFRVRHTSRRITILFVAWGRVKVELFKKNILGNFKPDRGDLEVEGTVFVKFIGNDPVPFDVADAKDDVKQVAGAHPGGGITIVTIPFVEGCGGVQNNGALRACSCAGTLPPGF